MEEKILIYWICDYCKKEVSVESFYCLDCLADEALEQGTENVYGVWTIGVDPA
jgi:hypothetical protein